MFFFVVDGNNSVKGLVIFRWYRDKFCRGGDVKLFWLEDLVLGKVRLDFVGDFRVML